MSKDLTQLPEFVNVVLLTISILNSSFLMSILLDHLWGQKHKTNVKVYEIRLATYTTLRDIFDRIYQTGELIENHELAKLSRTARFIFGKDISRFVSNFNFEYLGSKSYCNFEQFDKRFVKYLKIDGVNDE